MTTDVSSTVLTPAEHGVWVRLKSTEFPACNVWVSDTEIDHALVETRKYGRGKTRTPERVAENIARGIRCGSFPLSEIERRRRIRALP